MKTVKIDCNLHPITIMTIAPVNAPAWQKKSCFDSLLSNAYNLASSSHKLANIINLVMEELPVSSAEAFKESQLVADAIVASITSVKNLVPEAVLDSKC